MKAAGRRDINQASSSHHEIRLIFLFSFSIIPLARAQLLFATGSSEMDSKISTEVSAEEIPEGFTAADPNNSSAAAAGGGGGGGGAAAQAEAAEAQREAILQQALTPDALARLRRIKLVKPDKAKAVENAIASMAMQGRLPGQINEGKLVEMLERGAGAGAAGAKAGGGNVSIQRKKYAFDSDDDDDDDNDLL